MKCPGSVSLSYGVKDDDDNEFSGPGKAAHALAANCLLAHEDAWLWIGRRISTEGKLFCSEDGASYTVDKEMADAVQLYLDAVRQRHPDRNQGNTYIERRFHCSFIHSEFYGTSDLVYWENTGGVNVLHVWDFKYGAGIVVEVKGNVQCMYYACGILEQLGSWNDIDTVVLHIHQPRGFHFDGPHRTWTISVDALEDWLYGVLVPAMDHALVSRETQSGEHCRFCPVHGRKCPQIMSDLSELEKLVEKMNTAAKLTGPELGRILTLMVPAMIARKQALKNATGMLNAGHKIKGWKLAKARSNREFKDGADDAAKETFGKHAYTVPKLKSPAQIDVMPEGEKFTTRWAFKPDAGNTVVPESDSRREVSTDTKSLFVAQKRGQK